MLTPLKDIMAPGWHEKMVKERQERLREARAEAMRIEANPNYPADYDRELVEDLYPLEGGNLGIFRIFGTWAVEEFGLQCLTHYYFIPARQLTLPHWESHMAAKRWVVLADFLAAQRAGIEIHVNLGNIQSTERNVSSHKRYRVLRRDGFRCCLCGRSATNGTRLEVDHRQSLHHGGSNSIDNLWTLCYECNRGKGGDSL